MRIHSALDPSLTRLNPPATSVFTPTLESVIPAGSILMFDVSGSTVSPRGAQRGRGRRRGRRARSAANPAGRGAGAPKGVNVKQLTSIFHPETAVAIVPAPAGARS